MQSWIRPKADALADLRHPSAWLLDWSRGRATTAGLSVSPQGALAIAAYYACLRTIAEDVGKLPLLVYRRLSPRGKERATEHPLYNLLHNAPNSDMTAMTFREVLTHHAVGWGNGYAEIVTDGRGEVSALYPIHPSRVALRRDDQGGVVYDVYGETVLGARDVGRVVRLPSENVLHIKGLGADGLSGYSVAQLAAESLGLSLAAQTFGAAFFGNGTALGGVLEHPGTLSDTAVAHLRESWQTRYGGPENANKPAILEEGMKWTRLGIPPDEAQFLETRQFQVREVARWFRMPPHKIQDLTEATFSNIEQQSIEYVTDTLMPWLVRWEQELRRKLFAREPDIFAEHLVLGLLRGDQAARAAYYKDLFNVGALSPNDIRELENENPIPGRAGDRYYIQMNMTTLDTVAGEPEGAGGGPPEGAMPPPPFPGAVLNGHHKERAPHAE